MLNIAIPALEVCAMKNYINAVTALGAVPRCGGEEIRPEDCDGLLLPGGYDLCPYRYGQENCACCEMEPALDDLQFQILDKFLALGKPVLGICRGHQLINVALGGTLIQDLPQAEDHKSFYPGKDRIHPCEALPDSFLGKLYGTHFTVNSSHHQGVDQLGKGLRVVLRSTDGVIEALEHESLPIWSVQFHPERMCFDFQRDDTVDGSLIFRFFLAQCEARR